MRFWIRSEVLCWPAIEMQMRFPYIQWRRTQRSKARLSIRIIVGHPKSTPEWIVAIRLRLMIRAIRSVVRGRVFRDRGARPIGSMDINHSFLSGRGGERWCTWLFEGPVLLWSLRLHLLLLVLVLVHWMLRIGPWRLL